MAAMSGEYMDAQMQSRFDAWDARMAAADADLKAYAHNLAQGNDHCCLAIEEAWGLAGLPPFAVSTVLAGIAGGLTDDEAFERLTTPDDGAGNCTASTTGDGQAPGMNKTPPDTTHSNRRTTR
jgi:hypothetical protein